MKFCDNGNCHTEEDFCSNGKLNEFYCDNGQIAVERFHKCLEICYNSACRKIVSRGGGGGSSSSSGGGSSVSVETAGRFYVWEDSISFFRTNLMKEDSVRFNILNLEYSLVISEVSDIVLFSVGSENSNLSVGETKNFDLNSDSVLDISIKVKSIDLINKEAVFDLNRI